MQMRLFVGYLINSDIYTHLAKSKSWQNALVLNPADRDLVEIQHQNDNYIGRYLTQDRVLLSEIRDNDQKAKEALKRYCPECNVDNLSIRVISQILIA